MAVSVEGLASAVKGRVVESGAPDYDESRALFNAMIDKRPAAIAYCADEADVVAALRYGTEHGLRIAVRGEPIDRDADRSRLCRDSRGVRSARWSAAVW